MIDHWEEKGFSEDSGTVTLEAGKRYDITMEFYQNGSGAQAHLFWEARINPAKLCHQGQLFPTHDARQPGGITGHYFAGSVYGDMRGTSHNVRHIDSNINFDWNTTGPKCLETPNAAAFRARLPKDYKTGDRIIFTWSDTNGDSQAQPAEVDFALAGSEIGGITMMPDLSFYRCAP